MPMHKPPIYVHASPFPYEYSSSEGSGESAHMRRHSLLDDAINSVSIMRHV